MIRHMRLLASNVVLCRSAGGRGDALISTSDRARVTCPDCIDRLASGGDKAGVSTDKPKGRSPAAAMAL